jgi:hypothetical protein
MQQFVASQTMKQSENKSITFCPFWCLQDSSSMQHQGSIAFNALAQQTVQKSLKKRHDGPLILRPLLLVQYADFEEAQEEAIPCHSRRGIKRESIMTHS